MMCLVGGRFASHVSSSIHNPLHRFFPMRCFGKKTHERKIKSLRKLNIHNRYKLILRACDALFQHIIEDPRRKQGQWHPLERILYHKNFRGWTKLRTIVGAFLHSKERYLLKDDGNRGYFKINLQHRRYVAQREEALKKDPSLSLSISERYRLRTEKQTENLEEALALRKKNRPPAIPSFIGKSDDPFKQ
jgi:hypothetical protein